ncbi:MAG: hypothetical protein EA383_15120 [Spirochaetaceae bacterium]|nr:MAG: hypothetical protein EA383_15120 [Spirochaetaceae bacterium]
MQQKREIGRFFMKWEGYNDKAAERVTNSITKVFGPRILYTLVTIATIAMVLVANNKWTG